MRYDELLTRVGTSREGRRNLDDETDSVILGLAERAEGVSDRARCIRLYRRGRSPEWISNRLGISPRTISKYLREWRLYGTDSLLAWHPGRSGKKTAFVKLALQIDEGVHARDVWSRAGYYREKRAHDSTESRVGNRKTVVEIGSSDRTSRHLDRGRYLALRKYHYLHLPLDLERVHAASQHRGVVSTRRYQCEGDGIIAVVGTLATELDLAALVRAGTPRSSDPFRASTCVVQVPPGKLHLLRAGLAYLRFNYDALVVTNSTTESALAEIIEALFDPYPLPPSEDPLQPSFGHLAALLAAGPLFAEILPGNSFEDDAGATEPPGKAMIRKRHPAAVHLRGWFDGDLPVERVRKRLALQGLNVISVGCRLLPDREDWQATLLYPMSAREVAQRLCARTPPAACPPGSSVRRAPPEDEERPQMPQRPAAPRHLGPTRAESASRERPK